MNCGQTVDKQRANKERTTSEAREKRQTLKEFIEENFDIKADLPSVDDIDIGLSKQDFTDLDFDLEI